MESELVKIAKLFSEREDEIQKNDEDPDIELHLLECIFSLTIQSKDPQTSSQNFSNLLSRVLIVWPNFLKNRSFSRLAQELPASQLHGFWTLVLLHRALY